MKKMLNKSGFISIELVIIAGVVILAGAYLVFQFMYDASASAEESISKVEEAVGL